MTEKSNGVFELENEEMANVSGGKEEGHFFTTEPHCRECGQKLENFSGKYKCTTEWCSLKGKTQKIWELDWH